MLILRRFQNEAADVLTKSRTIENGLENPPAALSKFSFEELRLLYVNEINLY